ncbi:MAG: LysR family transcriptional regulator [Betaproteobacteria bacterium]
MSLVHHARTLHQFVVVAQERSLTAAAQKLAVTQPALTKSIQRLEDDLGVRLLERLPRGVTLTGYGRALLPHAQRIDADCRLADLEMLAYGGGHTGQLKLGTGLMFGATLVPSAIAVVHARYPGITFQIDSAATDVNYPRLLAGELDMLFGVLPPLEALPEHLTYRVITEIGLRVIAGAQHPLLARRRVQARELAQYPWAVMQHDRDLVTSLTATLRREGATAVHIAVEATSLSSLVRLLKAGPYLSCVSEGIAGLPELGLALVPYPRRIVRGDAGVVRHRSLERYAPAELLIDAVCAGAKASRASVR